MAYKTILIVDDIATLDAIDFLFSFVVSCGVFSLSYVMCLLYLCNHVPIVCSSHDSVVTGYTYPL